MKNIFSFEKLRFAGLALIILGIVLALFGKVRSGSLVLAIGMGGFAYSRYLILAMKRRIELFLPLLIAGTLFIVSLTLPHAG
ncbi:MAG: hypothetical protein WCQ52_03670 [Actinomycetes bacterium]|jgi:hypothetical protein